MIKISKILICLSSMVLATNCAIPKNIFTDVRPHAEHVKQVQNPPQNCIELDTIRLLDFPEYDDEEYNRYSFINYFTNKTGKIGGDTFFVEQLFKSNEASEGYDKEPYLNGIAKAYRCENKDGFVKSKELMVGLTHIEPQGCKLLGKTSGLDLYIYDLEESVRKTAVSKEANTAFFHQLDKLYKVGDRSFFSHYEAKVKLYSCI